MADPLTVTERSALRRAMLDSTDSDLKLLIRNALTASGRQVSDVTLQTAIAHATQQHAYDDGEQMNINILVKDLLGVVSPPVKNQFSENLYEQFVGPRNGQPAGPSAPPAPPAPPPTINVRRSVIGWRDPITSLPNESGDAVIRHTYTANGSQHQMYFDKESLEHWWRASPANNNTNPMTRARIQPGEKTVGILQVEEDDDANRPAEGGRKKRRYKTQKRRSRPRKTRKR